MTLLVEAEYLKVEVPAVKVPVKVTGVVSADISTELLSAVTVPIVIINS